MSLLTVPATIVAILCLTCVISAVPIPSNAAGQISPAQMAEVPNHIPSHYVSSSIKELESSDKSSSIAENSLRQGAASTVQELLSPITSMLPSWVPFAPQRTPQQAATPVRAPTEKHEDQKAVHENHEHANEPVELLPEGVVAAGFYYEGQKANGEYFNEEMPQEEPLEVHSHDEEVSSPGKLHDDNSDHPYYVVDKPAEGPAPPPVVYFTSGLRSQDASAAAWREYYAKLQQYNDYYRRFGRALEGPVADI